jgi:hypothetical protein
MSRCPLLAALLGIAAFAVAAPAEAGGRAWARYDGGAHPKSSYYRGAPQVRGYVARRGGYSYTYEDAINTYGDARGRYGAANSLRDPGLGRQTPAGPFDHGFFFDSGVAPNGGQSPYMH